MAWVRFIGGRAVMRRHNGRVFSEAEYGLIIYRPGPGWNPAAARGATRARAWLNMRDCLRREKQLTFSCDGSGVLPAKSQRKAAAMKEERHKTLSPWLSSDGYSAMRVLLGSDPAVIANRIAFIEKTPRVFDGTEWIAGPKGSGGPVTPGHQFYGFDPDSRKWCDEMLIGLGYVLTEDEK
jgi:hypothetical protein